MAGPVTTNFLPSRRIYMIHPGLLGDVMVTYEQLLIAYQVPDQLCFRADAPDYEHVKHTFTGLLDLHPQSEPSIYAYMALLLRRERVYTRAVSN